MRFLVYLFTLLLFSTAVAQNPVILQGSYVTNVFGPSNFIKNPNAQNNTSDVFTSGGVITRSLTTPLVATTEFNVTTNTSTNNIYWTTRTFDAGTKNQNCEARFTYRGFTTGTTTAQITNNNTTVIAELVLVGSASDPRTVSINFPCGDPSTSKELRLQQSVAQLTGVNEIGGIYMGLATNMANVAQAEAVGGYNITVSGVYPQTTSSVTANLSLGSSTLVPFGKATSADAASGSVTFSYLPAGNYSIVYTAHSVTGIATSCIFQWYEDTSGQQSGFQYSANDTNWSMVSGYFAFTSGGSRTFRIRARRTGGSGICGIDPNLYAQMVVYRFPSSSELVVTPERQNVFGGVKWNSAGSYAKTVTGTTSRTTIVDAAYASANATFYGKGQAHSTANTFGIKIPQMPVGVYNITTDAQFRNQSASFSCDMIISDGTNDIARISASAFNANSSAIKAIYQNTSVADREFSIQLQPTNSTITCEINSTNGGSITPTIIITPLDQPTNSALYVQGPVKAAETGAAIPSGYQSETQSSQGGFTVYASNTPTTMASLTLQPGVYMLIGQSIFGNNNLIGATGSIMAIGTTTNSFTGTTQGLSRLDGLAFQAMTLMHYVTVTSTTTYYLVVQTTATSGNAQNIWGLRSIRLN